MISPASALGRATIVNERRQGVGSGHSLSLASGEARERSFDPGIALVDYTVAGKAGSDAADQQLEAVIEAADDMHTRRSCYGARSVLMEFHVVGAVPSDRGTNPCPAILPALRLRQREKLVLPSNGNGGGIAQVEASRERLAVPIEIDGVVEERASIRPQQEAPIRIRQPAPKRRLQLHKIFVADGGEEPVQVALRALVREFPDQSGASREP
jgi:hypothetical protein